MLFLNKKKSKSKKSKRKNESSSECTKHFFYIKRLRKKTTENIKKNAGEKEHHFTTDIQTPSRVPSPYRKGSVA